jgi:type I restriction enzyme R subunit
MPITPLVNIFDCQRFQAEVDRLRSTAAKADTIAYRTKRTVLEKMVEDPSFFRRFPKILEEVIQAWRDKRISDEEYLSKVVEVSNAIINRAAEDLPEDLQGREIAQAVYGLVNEVLNRWKDSLPGAGKIAAKAALKIDKIIRENKIVDWTSNPHVQNQMKNQIEDYLYALKEVHGIDLSAGDMDLILDQSIEIAKEMVT